MTICHSVKNSLLSDPINDTTLRLRVFLEALNYLAPTTQDSFSVFLTHRLKTKTLCVFLSLLAKVFLKFKCSYCLSRIQQNCLTQSWIMANLSNGCYRRCQEHIVRQLLVLDHRQQNCGCTQLEKCRYFTHVCVSDYDVKSSVFCWVAMRFVSCIDNRSLQSRFQTDFFFKKVSALRKLKCNRRTWHTFKFATNFSGTAEDLASDKVGRYQTRHFAKWHSATQ